MANSRELWTRLETLLELTVVAVTGCGEPISTWAVEHDQNEMVDCCEDGHAFIRVARIFPTGTQGASFPQQSSVAMNCVPQLAAQVELGIYRCVSTLDQSGNAPTSAQRTADALQIARDASIIYHVLRDNGSPNWSKFPIVLGQWTPVETQGGCAGGYWTFTVDVALCPCGPDLPLYPSETLWPEDDLFPGGG